jgi:type I restriction enzyme, S subunit
VDLNADHVSGAPTPSLLDWELRPVGSVGTVIRGASPRPQGDPRFYGGNIPRLMVEDVTRDGKFVTPVVDSLTEAGAKLSRPCKAGTLTIVCSGTVGIPSFLKVDACIHDGFLALIGIKKGYNDDYLYHQFRRLRQSFESSATHGGVFTNLTTAGVRDFEVQFPPTVAEQESIANALSDADALIESLEQLLTKKRQIKQGAMQELLTGKRRLPGFNGEWQEQQLGSLGTFLKGNGIKRENALSGDLPCIRYGEIYTHHKDCIKQFHSRISPAVAEDATQLKYGDLLFAGSGETKKEIGKCVAFVSHIKAYAGGDIVILRGDQYDPIFFGYYLNTMRIVLQKSSYGQGDAVVHIGAPALAKIKCFVPQLIEQRAVGQVIADLDSDIEAVALKLIKARQIKQGMMQELLTGRIRLV